MMISIKQKLRSIQNVVQTFLNAPMCLLNRWIAGRGQPGCPEPEDPWSQTAWIWWLTIVLLLVAKFSYLSRSYMFMDPAQYLYAAQLWLEGGALYRDFVDTNPPFVIFFSVPPILLSYLTRIATDTALWIYVFSLIVLSLSILRPLLRSLLGTDSPLLVHAIWFVMALAMLSPSNAVFGQREHVALILLLPYLTASSLQGKGIPQGGRRALPLLIAILAGCGVLLKPYLAIIPCSVEIYLAVVRRSWKSLFRSESLAISGCIILYLIIVLSYTPDYFRYANYAVETLWAYNHQGNALLLSLERALPLLLAGAGLLFFGDRRDAALLRLLWLAALLFYISAVVYGKYWLHHLFPHRAICSVIAGIILLRLSFRFHLPRRSWTLLPVLFLFGIWGIISQEIRLAQGKDVEQVRNDRLIPLVRDEAHGESIYCLSTHLGDCFPLVNYTGTKLAGRFAFLWPIPGYYLMRWVSLPASERILSPAALSSDNPKERQIMKEVVGDLIHFHPHLILVERNKERNAIRSVPFDPLGYFLQDKAFALFFRNYHLWRCEETSGRDTYIYRRSRP